MGNVIKKVKSSLIQARTWSTQLAQIFEFLQISVFIPIRLCRFVCCNALEVAYRSASSERCRSRYRVSGMTLALSPFPCAMSSGFRFAALMPGDESNGSASNSSARVGGLDAVKPESPDPKRREESQKNSGSEHNELACRHVYQHCTFCSLCKGFRTIGWAAAKCEACPRILCRKCAGQMGEKVSRAWNAEDAVFPAAKCLCQSKDSEFPRPPAGKDPKAHLLKHLRRHDLSLMFREPVDVEDAQGYLSVVPRDNMMDLSTVKTRMKKRKEYQSPRGQIRFRADLNKIWANCRTYARYIENPADGEVAGIVRCTHILEAMTHRFYTSYMNEDHDELVETWQAEIDRHKDERFARCKQSSGAFSDEVDQGPSAAAEFEFDFGREFADVDNEFCRTSTTVVGQKRKFGMKDNDDDDHDHNDFTPDCETVVESTTMDYSSSATFDN